jgi:TonB family protein
MTRLATVVLCSSIAVISAAISRAADQPIVIDPSKPLKIVMEGRLEITVNGVSVSRYPNLTPIFTRSPKPEYPIECRRRHITGNGIFHMNIDEKGVVKSTAIQRSTGHSELDAAVIKAFSQARAKPGAIRDIDVPVTFAMGAAGNPAATRYVPRTGIHTPKDDLSTMQR